MKANIPKAWQNLPASQRKSIEDYATKIAIETAMEHEERDCRIILDLYMKFTILILHDAFGFGERRLTRFIANHRRLFHKQAKLVSKGEQLKYLDERMAEIFKKDGFPQDYIDGLLGEVEVVEQTWEEEQN